MSLRALEVELQASRERQEQLRSRLHDLERLETIGLQDLHVYHTEMKRREEQFMKLQVEESARQRQAIEIYQQRMESERLRLIDILLGLKNTGLPSSDVQNNEQLPQND